MVAERDTKLIIRQWNREIDDETRQLVVTQREQTAWKLVVWTALWLLWLALLIGLVALIRPFHG